MLSGVSRSGVTPLGVTSMPAPDRAETLPEVPRFSPRSAMARMTWTSWWRRSGALTVNTAQAPSTKLRLVALPQGGKS